MSEKSLRGAGPGTDQAPDPAAPSGGRSPDSGAAPVEPWSGDRTDRVSGREGSGPRVALVPAGATDSGKVDGKVEAPVSIPDTKRVDSGRTTLMGVPSPMAEREKPTSPGHDLHLPSEKARPAGARPVAPNGVIPEVELDPSSTRRIGKVESPGQAGPGAEAAATAKGERKDSDSKALVLSDRSLAAVAATFRASARAAHKPSGVSQDADREADRGGWTTDRTQEFHLPTEPPDRTFAKTLSIGIGLALGLGIMVHSFIHSRVRGGASESTELVHAAAPLPAPVQALPPAVPALPENPLPSLPAEPTNAAREPLAAPAPPPLPEMQPPPAQPAEVIAPAAIATTDEALKAERRTAPRPKALAPAGRPAPARTARAAIPVTRPTLSPEPATTPAAAAPTTPPALTPPPQPERPARAASPKTEPGTKPYDPDMPLPPSMD